MAASDIAEKLRQVQERRLVSEFCAAVGKARPWFYKALRGRASLLPYLEQLDAVLAEATHPVRAAREELGLSRQALACALGVSRQTIYAWEHEPAKPERVEAVLSLKSST